MSPELAELGSAGRRNGFLATILDTVASLVLVLDREGRIVLFNHECERVSGYSAAEVLGRHVFDVVIAPEDVARVKGVFRELRAGAQNSYDNVWIRKDGARREIAWTNTILPDAEGGVAYVVPTGVDVTERRAAERRLRQTEEKLAEAARLEAMGRLAGGVAHDFNNLLVVLLSGAAALREALPAALQGDVLEIEQAARKAAALTQQLLAFGRRRVVCPQALDVNRVVADEVKMLRRLVGEDVAVEAKLDPAAGAVLADVGGLQQVLMNLAVNARDAMPHGGTLTIETAAVEGAGDPALPDGPCVRLSVRDTGVGIPPEVMRHLFEPFFTTKGEGRGTGLGLATTFGIVKQAGGHVTVASSPGAGACFSVLLPRHGDATAAAPPPPTLAPRPCAGVRSVLVVEDDPAVLRVAARTLRAAGYRVEATQDAGEALRLAAAGDGAFDLLLTDVIMPGLGGPELAERFRAISPRAKVVVMSGYAGRDVDRWPGDALLLAKPFDGAALLDVVARALECTHAP